METHQHEKNSMEVAFLQYYVAFWMPLLYDNGLSLVSYHFFYLFIFCFLKIFLV
jgi:hypothetical protein